MQPIKSYRIETGEIAKYTVYLVGCGGTGSFCALHLARLAYVALQKDIKLDLIFIDPDHAEVKNIGRQNFAPSEVGQPKAVALARRYSYAFGLQMESRVARFQAAMVQSSYRELCLVIGCVDNTAARREISRTVAGGRVWWLDSGNSLDSGQVLIGNSPKPAPVIDPTGFATGIPWPSLQEPSLLDGEPTPAPETPAASCAELLAAEVQSLMINQAMAGIVATYASRLIMGRDLDVMATYINLGSLSMRSVAITGEVGRIEPVKVEGPVTEQEAGDGILGAWELGELLDIANERVCPECGGQVTNGRDMVDTLEFEIVFCPNCHWIIRLDELNEALQQAVQEMEPAR